MAVNFRIFLEQNLHKEQMLNFSTVESQEKL